MQLRESRSSPLPVIRGLGPKGLGQARGIIRWKPAPGAFAVNFPDRVPAAENP